MSGAVTAEYKTFLKEIKDRIYKAQYDALKAVNKKLIQLYWDIGKSIVAKQEKLDWVKEEKLSVIFMRLLQKSLQNDLCRHTRENGYPEVFVF
ncbi:MAG TPA: DUF1016 family protein [Nitrospirae bacterium]|nr:hypothetical protein BMS3Abin06_01006 [bacterium BMS3Abin06]HDH11081.1 DUF1016 family protein [Nitrospirota bacterium]HDZ02298.1 DUF1016 family protein [Nitrospirota bacterium]